MTSGKKFWRIKIQTMNIRYYTRPKRFGFLLAVNVILLISVIGLLLTGNKEEEESSSGTPAESEREIQIVSSESSSQQMSTEHTVEQSPQQTAETNPQQTESMDVPVLSPAVNGQNELNELKSRLNEYIEKQQGRYGLYYINLITKEEFGINDREEYIAASTTKLPMNMFLYREIEAGRIDPDSILTYREENYEPGTGILQESEFGTNYTVREAARLSIVYSDNCAMNMIIELLGIDNIRKYMLDIGGTIYYGESHRTCPYDLAVYAAQLYKFYRESPEIAGILIDDLQNTIWNDRINKFLPEDVRVPHKIGNYPKVYNDVGIVFATRPYALAIMSDNIEQETASDVIATISKMIYDYVE